VKINGKILAAVIVILIVSFTPIPRQWKDGGTSTYEAIAYRIVDYSRNVFVYPGEMQQVHVQIFPKNLGPWPEVEYRA